MHRTDSAKVAIFDSRFAANCNTFAAKCNACAHALTSKYILSMPKLMMVALSCVVTLTLAATGGLSCASSESQDDKGQGAANSSSGLGGSLGIGGQGGGGLGTCATASDEVVASPVDVIFAIDQSASMGEEI